GRTRRSAARCAGATRRGKPRTTPPWSRPATVADNSVAPGLPRRGMVAYEWEDGRVGEIERRCAGRTDRPLSAGRSHRRLATTTASGPTGIAGGAGTHR